VILDSIVDRLMEHVQKLGSIPRVLVIHGSLDLWLIAIGMVASTATAKYRWFAEKAQATFTSLYMGSWNQVLARIKSVLWLDTPRGESVFRPHWDAFLVRPNRSISAELAIRSTPASGIIP